MPSVIRKFVKIISSLELTVLCLALSMILVFFGTLAQVHLGIYGALRTFFHSIVVWWSPPNSNWRIPILPGGYLVGTVLLFNLIAAHIYRFRWTWRKAGIFLTHIGVILLLLGELLTSVFARESQMRIDVGQTKNYSESYRKTELAIVDTSDPTVDHVVAIPEARLESGSTIQYPALPFTVTVKSFFGNSRVFRRPADMELTDEMANVGLGANYFAQQIPRTGKMDDHDLTTAVIELRGVEGSLGRWMVCNGFDQPQGFDYAGRHYELELRQKRTYKPFAITLNRFTHDVYPGTDIPKNFASLIHLADPNQHVDREVKIWMNHPLRYAGLTFYQAGFDNNNRTTVLQVVHNPSSTLPYIACALVTIGLAVQFAIHLVGFINRRTA